MAQTRKNADTAAIEKSLPISTAEIVDTAKDNGKLQKARSSNVRCLNP